MTDYYLDRLAHFVAETRFDAILYNLEHEQHEIWSVNSFTFFLRSEPPAVAGG